MSSTCWQGAAVGAQDNVVDTAHIFIAIAAHKGLAAYALGSSLVDSCATGARFWSVIATFAMATPVGIGLGMLLASVATGHVASGVSALASGEGAILLVTATAVWLAEEASA